MQAIVEPMKRVKIIVAVGAVLGVAVVATWLARDRIIQRLTGPLLERYGWVITDVSLDALATSDASIGHIELAHEGGTVVVIEDLVLAVRKSAAGRRAYSASRVTVSLPEAAGDDATDVAAAIRQVLGLPDVLTDVDVAVGELQVADYPLVNDLAWSTFPGRQVLGARIRESDIAVELRGDSASSYEARLDLAAPSGESQGVDLRIEDLADRVRLSIAAEPQFSAWRAWLERAALLPIDLDVEGGNARIEAALDVPDGPSPALAFRGTVVPDVAWRFRIVDDARVTAEITTPIDIVASLPDGAWSIGVDSADIDLDVAFAGDLDFRITSIACRNGIVCTFATDVVAEDLVYDGFGADGLELSARVEVDADPGGAGMRATVQPDAVIKVLAASSNDVRAERIEASIVSGATLTTTESGWRLTADSIDMAVEKLDSGDIRANASVFLEASSIESGEDGMKGRSGLFVPSIDARYGDYALRLPGVRGDVTLAGQAIAAALQTVGLQEEGGIRLTYDLESGEGEAQLSDLVNDLANRPLSKLLSGGPEGFDLTAGKLTIDAGFRWQPDRPLRGDATLRLADAAGLYSAIAFTGVTTELELSLDARDGIEVQPASISAGFADIGVALRDLTANYRLWPGDEAVDVSNLEMTAFGGKISADPFRLASSGDETTILVHARSVNLAEMLSIQEFDKVEVTGFVDADLPVTLGEGGIRIADGKLNGIPPGGVIRYRQATAAASADTSAVGFATQALSNFEYETLSSDVRYEENGDLVLKMQIRGSNPDFENGRPIVLNLGVENNVRDMLRSLQATRSAQDVIERRINR